MSINEKPLSQPFNSTMSDPTSELAKAFDPHQVEEQLLKFWAEKNISSVSIQSNQENFCIQLPPPNVTGTLHTTT